VVLIELVAWRSSLAEARNAVAVSAASETRARTLIKANPDGCEWDKGWDDLIINSWVSRREIQTIGRTS